MGIMTKTQQIRTRLESKLTWFSYHAIGLTWQHPAVVFTNIHSVTKSLKLALFSRWFTFSVGQWAALCRGEDAHHSLCPSTTYYQESIMLVSCQMNSVGLCSTACFLWWKHSTPADVFLLTEQSQPFCLLQVVTVWMDRTYMKALYLIGM